MYGLQLLHPALFLRHHENYNRKVTILTELFSVLEFASLSWLVDIL